ncbi:hypothetical protein [Neorhizobium alkalisoli]|uniref:hypothetical protein n=1 Tax=Neorhizobium alkalisoli TaxID=528178 RepID=UPI000CF8C255|nr:hypothetical protein [Neorhizobium alkalisoli]
MTHSGETKTFDRIERPNHVGTGNQSIGSRDEHMDTECRHRCPEDEISPQGRSNSFDQEQGIRIIEAIYDVIGLRERVPKTALQDEFDFFGSMVRAKRIFEKLKT